MYMPSRRHKKYFYISCFALILLVLALFCGCLSTNMALNGNNSGKPVVTDSGTVPAIPNITSPGNQGAVEPSNDGNTDIQYNAELEKAWKTLRIINTDTNERYLKLDLTKSDDVNYLRYLLVPDTVQRIDLVQI